MNKSKQKILIVDDSEMNRAILADMLGEEFEIMEACDGIEAVNVLRSHSVELSLVLLDIVMPKMDGLEVLAMMNSYKWIQNIPVIMISAESGSSYIGRAYELGATDYIQRPFDAMVVHRRVQNAIMLYSKQKNLIGLVEEQIYEKQKDQSLLINILSNIVELRNGESGLHVLHVYTMTEILLQNLMKMTDHYPLTPQEISLIATASSLHDIGKIAVDDNIVMKHEKLTPKEEELLKKHTEYGEKMLHEIPFPQSEPLLKVSREICRSHHERYDGSGYPDGLKGDEIPISAQVVGLADVYDELTSSDSHKEGIPHDQAIEMILSGKCGAFNPVLLKVLQWSADRIRNDLRVSSLSGSTRKDLERNTREAISRSGIRVSRRTLDLLEREREKYRFIASDSREILFEVYRDPAMISFLSGGEEKLGVGDTVTDPLNDAKMIACFGEETLKKLFELISSATSENPKVSLNCTLNIQGKPCRSRIVIMTQYSRSTATDKYEFESAIGKIYTSEEDASRGE
ncbi:MAG: response regulator [Clostridia bacterium]|nr:response regulator [Clostridia bacterium]